MMTEEELTQFTLHIESPDAGAEELEELTRQLRGEILETPVEAVELVTDETVSFGAKGIAGAAPGELAITTRPSVLPDFLGALRDWLTRHEDRRVEITANIGGNMVNIKASITDFTTIVQVLGGSTQVSRSGGADLQADQISVGGDVTGRDKITIHAEAGATVIVGQSSAAPVKTDPLTPLDTPASTDNAV